MFRAEHGRLLRSRILIVRRRHSYLAAGALPLLAARRRQRLQLEQIYNAAQGWRRNECYKIGDLDQRERCLKEANRPYDAYDKATKS